MDFYYLQSIGAAWLSLRHSSISLADTAKVRSVRESPGMPTAEMPTRLEDISAEGELVRTSKGTEMNFSLGYGYAAGFDLNLPGSVVVYR